MRKTLSYSLVYFKDRVGGGGVERLVVGEEGRITGSNLILSGAL